MRRRYRVDVAAAYSVVDGVGPLFVVNGYVVVTANTRGGAVRAVRAMELANWPTRSKIKITGIAPERATT